MQRMGYHERLGIMSNKFLRIAHFEVNILACVTSSDPILLIFEYCANGDLLEFLRKK